MVDNSPAILVVDDELDVRSSLGRILRMEHYAVEEACSLAELRARDDLDQFVCIILDRKLPDGMSDDVLAELSERAPDTAVLIITGYTDLEGTLSALRHGAEDYLIKPVNPESLRASLRRQVRLREMKTALRESEARHRGILETVPVGILTLDEGGTIESVNPAIETIFGFTAEELMDHSIHTMLASSHRDKWQRCFQANIGNDTDKSGQQELMARKKGGEKFPVAVTLSSVQLPGKRVVTVIVEDITARKQLEKEVLKASEEERHRIAQDLHDGLASHFTGVSLMSRMLASQVDAEQVAIANQIGDLIDDGVHQTRTVARGLYPVEDHPEGLMNSLSQLATRFRNDLKIDCRFDCSPPVYVEDNETATHLYRIAQEAANNALRHGKAEQIIIELTQSEEELTLIIRDNGQGVAESDSDRPKGIGLRTMAYRAGLLQGTFLITPCSGGGTEVVCVIPSKLSS
jgi:two-component system, LuxR family, sensor kinase FixL